MSNSIITSSNNNKETAQAAAATTATSQAEAVLTTAEAAPAARRSKKKSLIPFLALYSPLDVQRHEALSHVDLPLRHGLLLGAGDERVHRVSVLGTGLWAGVRSIPNVREKPKKVFFDTTLLELRNESAQEKMCLKIS